MGISKHLSRVRRQLVRTSCLVVAVCLLAGALFVLSSLTHIPDRLAFFGHIFGHIWGAADADAAKKRQKKDDDWDPPIPTPKVTVPTKPTPQPVVKTDKKNDVNDNKKNDANDKKNDVNDQRQDDDDNNNSTSTNNAKKNEKTRPAAAAADVDDTPDIPSTLQGVLSKWLAPSKPLVTTPTQAVPTNKVTTGATSPTQGQKQATPPLSQAVHGSAAKAWSAKTTIEPAAAKAAAASAAAASMQTKSADGAVRNRGGADLSLRVPLVNQAHILARNLTAQTLKNATDLGLKVKSSRSFDVIGTTVTQLVVPPHLDIAQARAALQQAAPNSALSFNQQYRLYPQAKGDGSQVSQEPARATGGCTPDRCYGAQTIGWQGELGSCARDLKIGVIDTGIDGSHPALSHDPGRISYGVIGPEKRAPGNDLHGTGVLALLAGDPRSSTPGLVPRAKFFVADIFFADENGLPVSTTMHLLEALDWMERMQVQIINLSLSGPSDDLVKAAIAKMSRTRTVDGTTRSGTIFIAAAGNGGPGAPPSYPAAYSEVVAVTAVGKDLRSYRRANQGDYIDIAAPGVDIWTALPNGRQGFQTGTSFATPYVTAVIASVYRSLPRVHTKTAVLQRLPVHDLGIPGPDRVYGRGLVNAPASCDPDKMPVATRRIPVVPTTKVSAN